MNGQMMDYELTLLRLLERAQKLYAGKEIVTRGENELIRSNYGQVIARAGKLAHALQELGIQPGARVATLAWNNTRHLELYYAVPCMGAVLHPINLRVLPEDIIFILNQAEDQVLFFDPSLLALVEKIAPHLKTVRQYIVMDERMPAGITVKPALVYEDLLAAQRSDYAWPTLHENQAAAICYTSGTTGSPKGVVYSHRSIYMHCLGLCMVDSTALSEADTFMPVVPMFHVLAWGFPYACAMVGSKQVFPGRRLAPQDLAGLISSEKVTISAGVPTLWLGMLNLIDRETYDLSSVRMLISGGAATPRSMIEGYYKRHGLQVVHAWGMTETSPLGTINHLKAAHQGLSEDEKMNIRVKQGLPAVGIEIRAVDEGGHEVAWDGKTTGELQVRGAWVAGSYYADESSQQDLFADGWFRTGDIVTIDAEGYVEVIDRLKDLVKSGGEWISTQGLEKALMDHPKVLEAAVIAVPHPKWQERPLAIVMPRTEYQASIDKMELLQYLSQLFPRMYLPDDVVFVEALPKTSVGKYDKKTLREKYKEYVLPETPK